MRYLLAITVLLFTCNPSQAQQWRVVGKVYEKFYSAGSQYNVHDSTTYQYDYNKQRGSSLLNDTILCDWERKYGLLGSNAPQIVYANHYTYNNDDQCVTQAHYANDGLFNNWDLISTDTATYTSGKLTRKIYYHIAPSPAPKGYEMQPTSNEIFEYNTNGQVNAYFKGRWTGRGVAMLTDTKHYYTYNSADQLLLDSLSYLYLSVFTFLPGTQNASVYDAQGKLIEKVRYYIDTPSNKVNNRTYYYYNAQGQLVGDSVQTFHPPNVIIPQNIHSYTYDAAGRIATDTLKLYLGGATQLHQLEVTTYAYTSFGCIDKIVKRVYRAVDNAIINTETTKYYYEHYWPLEVGNGIRAFNPNIVIAPNPATNYLFVYWEVEQGITHVQGRMINIQGQAMKHWEDNVNHTYSKRISLADVSNGLYFLELYTDKGLIRKKVLVAKP